MKLHSCEASNFSEFSSCRTSLVSEVADNDATSDTSNHNSSLLSEAHEEGESSDDHFCEIDIDNLPSSRLTFDFTNEPSIHIYNDEEDILTYLEYFINSIDLINTPVTI